MSELTTLKNEVYNITTSVVSQYVADENAHVIREDDDEPDQPPMVALNGQTRERTSQNRHTGLHDVRVLELSYNPFDVKYGRERTFSVDMTIADTDGNRADNILEDLQNAFEFDPRYRDPSTFVNSVPVEQIRVQNASPTNRGQRQGHALSVEIDFVRTFNFSEVDNPPTEVTKIKTAYDNGRTITIDENGIVSYSDS